MGQPKGQYWGQYCLLYMSTTSQQKERKVTQHVTWMIMQTLLVKTQSEALSSLVNYCEALKFSSFEQERSFWQMSSFEETKALDIFNNETNSKKFLSYNCRNLSRVYPKGTRLFSSNMSRMQCFQKKIKQIFPRSVSILDNGMPNGSSQLSGGKTSVGEVAHLS